MFLTTIWLLTALNVNPNLPSAMIAYTDKESCERQIARLDATWSAFCTPISLVITAGP